MCDIEFSSQDVLGYVAKILSSVELKIAVHCRHVFTL